jgi:hypothetical protein
MVYDAGRNIVYISTASQVSRPGQILRYSLASSTFLNPIILGGNLYGIDLSPDGKTLAVADMAHSSARSWIHLVDVGSLIDDKHSFENNRAFGLAGTWAPAYAANGDLYVTTDSDSSCCAYMEVFKAASGNWSSPNVTQARTMVSASGNGQIIAFTETNANDGKWGHIDDASGTLKYGYGPGCVNYDIAANNDGSQFLIPTAVCGGLVFENDKRVKVLGGTYAKPQPLGVAYGPVRHIAYMPWKGTSNVLVYDMDAIQQTGSLDFGTSFVQNGNSWLDNGRTRISRDGSLLMVQLTGGVQIDQLYAPLSASNANASVTAGSPVVIPVSANLGIPGDFTFSLPEKPAHGTATVSGNTVVYTPDYSFSGTETFNYQAHYSQAVANGTITVAVSPSVNQPPVAVDDTIHSRGAVPVLIPVLANDSDPDGQALSIISATQPAKGKGSISIQDNGILYTPAGNKNAITAFTYTISDGHGGTASATCYVFVHAALP